MYRHLPVNSDIVPTSHPMLKMSAWTLSDSAFIFLQRCLSNGSDHSYFVSNKQATTIRVSMLRVPCRSSAPSSTLTQDWPHHLGRHDGNLETFHATAKPLLTASKHLAYARAFICCSIRLCNLKPRNLLSNATTRPDRQICRT